MAHMSSKVNTTPIKIQGFSGCTIELLNSASSIIRKSTTDPQYIPRLLKQANKQRGFPLNPESPIIIPEILGTYCNSLSCYIDMEYFPSLDFIERFQCATVSEINNTLKVLFDFIEFNIRYTVKENIPGKVLVNKIEEIYSKVPFSNKPEILSKIPDELLLPIGHCHGDLTFSNILFQDDKLIFIDFLDSFISTPLIDIVKLRQDTKYNWSQQLYTRPFHEPKLNIVLDYMDNKIVEKFQQYDFFKYYPIFQIVNLLRILPYAKNSEIICNLNSHIYNILENEWST